MHISEELCTQRKSIQTRCAQKRSECVSDERSYRRTRNRKSCVMASPVRIRSTSAVSASEEYQLQLLRLNSIGGLCVAAVLLMTFVCISRSKSIKLLRFSSGVIKARLIAQMAVSNAVAELLRIRFIDWRLGQPTAVDDDYVDSCRQQMAGLAYASFMLPSAILLMVFDVSFEMHASSTFYSTRVTPRAANTLLLLTHLCNAAVGYKANTFIHRRLQDAIFRSCNADEILPLVQPAQSYIQALGIAIAVLGAWQIYAALCQDKSTSLYSGRTVMLMMFCVNAVQLLIVLCIGFGPLIGLSNNEAQKLMLWLDVARVAIIGSQLLTNPIYSAQIWLCTRQLANITAFRRHSAVTNKLQAI